MAILPHRPLQRLWRQSAQTLVCAPTKRSIHGASITTSGASLSLHRVALQDSSYRGEAEENADPSVPPIVVLHGLLGNALNWKGVMKKIVEGLPQDMRSRQRVYLVDARNHGMSPWSSSMGYEDMSNDLLQLLDEEGIERTKIVGHSMGGKTAMHFLLRHQERVDRAVIVDISPVDYVKDPRWQPHKYVDAMMAVDLQRISSRREANEAMRAITDDARLRLFLLTNLQRLNHADNDSSMWRWRVNLDSIREHIYELGQFTATEESGMTCDVPVLFVRGERSYYVNDFQYSSTIPELFPSYSISTIMDAGHWCHTDNPDHFARITREFLV